MEYSCTEFILEKHEFKKYNQVLYHFQGHVVSLGKLHSYCDK